MICPACEGEGRRDRLGGMTSDEFRELFPGPEEQERYFSGDYDKVCETCKGSGKITEEDYQEHINWVNDPETIAMKNGMIF